MPVISVSHLRKYYSIHKRQEGLFSSVASLFTRPKEIVKAVDDISFTIEPGELVGFIGPNGAGKTTTLKCLAGLLYPSEGSVSVLGYRSFERKTEFLKRISFVMGQKNQLWWDLPVTDTFELHREMYEIPEKKYRKTLEQLVTLLDVRDLLAIPVRKLSLGQRMKMELITALLHRPKVLFLDEPTIGLDVVMQKKMRDFIAVYNKEHISTILLTSHYMEDVKELCKRVIIINHGRLLYDGDLSKLVERYANTKIITVETESMVSKRELAEYGSVKSFTVRTFVLSVSKNDAPDIAAAILRRYKVCDFTIEDPDIEDVIRLVFAKHP